MLFRNPTSVRNALLIAGLLPFAASVAPAASNVTLQFAPGSSAADAAIPNHTFHMQLVGSGTEFSNPCVGLDLRVTCDRAKVDLTGTGTPSAEFPFSAALSPLAGSLPSGTSPSNYRHISAADLGGSTTFGLPSVPSAPVLADIAITTSASPASPFTIAISKNDRTPHPINDALLFQQNISASNLPVLKPSVEPTYTNTAGVGLGATDSDGDGVIDSLEYRTNTGSGVVPPAGVLNGFLPDSDGDGMSDSQEVNFNTAGAALYDYVYTAGSDTNPRAADTDGDTYSDGMEFRNPAVFPNGPLVADTPTDTDGDKIPNALDPSPSTSEVDHDADRLLDTYELALGTSITSNTSFPQLGNVNGADGTVSQPIGSNGYINFVDVTVLNQFFHNNNPPGMQHADRADVNRDGRINFIDVTALNQFRLGTKLNLP